MKYLLVFFAGAMTGLFCNAAQASQAKAVVCMNNNNQHELNDAWLTYALQGDIARAKQLVGDGAKPNVHNNGSTFLIDAIARDKGIQKVKNLILAGADVNVPDEKMRTTPLMWAVGLDEQPIVELLLSHRVFVNAQDGQGDTALAYAMCQGTKKSVIELLFNNGADVTIKNHEGKTVDSYITAATKPEIVALINGQKIQKKKQLLMSKVTKAQRRRKSLASIAEVAEATE